MRSRVRTRKTGGKIWFHYVDLNNPTHTHTHVQTHTVLPPMSRSSLHNKYHYGTCRLLTTCLRLFFKKGWQLNMITLLAFGYGGWCTDGKSIKHTHPLTHTQMRFQTDGYSREQPLNWDVAGFSGGRKSQLAAGTGAQTLTHIWNVSWQLWDGKRHGVRVVRAAPFMITGSFQDKILNAPVRLASLTAGVYVCVCVCVYRGVCYCAIIQMTFPCCVLTVGDEASSLPNAGLGSGFHCSKLPLTSVLTAVMLRYVTLCYLWGIF